jgi:hypothetical protein
LGVWSLLGISLFSLPPNSPLLTPNFSDFCLLSYSAVSFHVNVPPPTLSSDAVPVARPVCVLKMEAVEQGIAQINQNNIFGKFADPDSRKKLLDRHFSYTRDEPAYFERNDGLE